MAVAVTPSFYEGLGLEGDIGVAMVRSCAQLTARGYAIEQVSKLESVGAVALPLAGMVLFAAWTSAGRAMRDARWGCRAFTVAALAVGAAAVATSGPLLVLRVVPATARQLIPLGGMVIGNSMNARA